MVETQPRTRNRRKYRRIRLIAIVTTFFILILLLLGLIGYAIVHLFTGNQSKSIPVKTNQETQIVQKPLENPKVAYLTFDDGPTKYTDEILDILKENHVNATFFMLGYQIPRHKNSVVRLVDEGHYPGLHSMTHDNKKLYKSGSSSNFIKEFKQEQEIVFQLTGVHSILIRAPYGSSPYIGKRFRGDIAAEGFKLWDWTTDSMDWSLPGKPKEIISRIKSKIKKDPEVILMHEKKQTVEALPEIIAYLKKEGYELKVFNPDKPITVNFSGDERL